MEVLEQNLVSQLSANNANRIDTWYQPSFSALPTRSLHKPSVSLQIPQISCPRFERNYMRCVLRPVHTLRTLVFVSRNPAQVGNAILIAHVLENYCIIRRDKLVLP